MNRTTLALAALLLVSAFPAAHAQDRPEAVAREATRHAPYHLDHIAHKREIEDARNDGQRTAALRKRWNQVKFAVAYYRATDDARFGYSFGYWRTQWLHTGTWSVSTGDLEESLVDPGIETVRIEGDCLADITVPDAERALIHVYGDLHGTITVGDHSEVVIAGDVVPGAAVVASRGRVDLFVGGEMAGELRNEAALQAWVHGDFSGDLHAGALRNGLLVRGDFTGEVYGPAPTKLPTVPPLALKLDVRGSMPARTIRAATRLGFRSFVATVGGSDHEPGMFMDGSSTGGGPQSMWVVRDRQHAQGAWHGEDFRLDASEENAALAAAVTNEQRLEALGTRWDRVVRAVLHHRAADSPAFHYSDRFWRHGHLATNWWSRAIDDLSDAIYDPKVRTILVRGDCHADIVIPRTERAIVHIYGDLHGTVSVGQHSEVVIGGDVKPFGRVVSNGDGFVDVFVGGDVEGAIESERYVSAWVHGNLEGEVAAGAVCTNVTVLGDLTGSIGALPGSAKLRLDVRGFAPADTLLVLRELAVNYLLVTIGSSDHPLGLYHREDIDPPGLSSVIVVHGR